MHRATVFDALLLSETDSGGNDGIDCQGYAKHQHSKQKELPVYAFHIYFSLLKRIEVSDPPTLTGVPARVVFADRSASISITITESLQASWCQQHPM
jgi:hypothetical protein